MSDCTKYHTLMSYLQTGDIREDELLALRAHGRECPECAALLAAHDRLFEAGQEAPELTATESARLRREVRARISPPASGGFWQDLRAFLNRHPVTLAPVAGAALVAVFLLGRWSAPAPEQQGDGLLALLNQQAEARQSVTEYLDNPLMYRDVNARLRGDRVALSFEVARHVELETGLDSPLARDALLAAMVDDTSLGSKLRAIELAPALGDPGLQEALVFTLRNDPNAAARLECIDALTRFPDGPAVRQAFLHTLDRDPSVQIRMAALDHLIRRGEDPERIRQAITTTELEGDAAVMRYALQLQRSQS